MKGILNEHTGTVHKQERGASNLHTACGVSYNLDPEKLRAVPVGEVAAEPGVDKCGRCFKNGGSY
jgi:hypothetical protein